MHISKDGIDLIKQFKGCRLTAYRDRNNHWAIGYGHTTNVEDGMQITFEQADAWLIDDLHPMEEAVEGMVSVPLTQHEFDALVALVFDLGTDVLHHSDLLAFLNAHQYDRAADAFLEMSNDRRRSAERELFLAPPRLNFWQKLVARLRG